MKKTLIYIAVFALMVSASGLVTYLFFDSGRASEAPDLKGKSLAEAEAVLKSLGLFIEVASEEYDSQIPAGSIISQDIPAGTVLKGGEIKVVLSKGTLSKPLPYVVGMNVKEAKAAFQKERIPISSIIYVHSNTAPADRVIAQGAGPEDTALVVSAGPYDVIYYCPQFEGMAKEEAVELAEELGLNAVVSGDGLVVASQTPKAGSLVRPGQKISLTLGGEHPEWLKRLN